MKRNILIFSTLVMSVSLLSGCHISDTRHSKGVVLHSPPPVKRVSPPPRPSGHAWIPGRWVRHGKQWQWAKGHYQRPPHDRYRWKEGHWQQRSNGWIWISGRWIID